MLPWDERQRLGFPTALLETAKLIVTDPKNAFSRIRQDGDFIGPILYAVIFGVVGIVANQIWNMLFGNVLIGMMGGGLEEMAAMGGGGLFGLIINVILSPFYVVIGLFIGAGIIHVCTMIVGIANNSPNGFEGTLKVAAYAQTAQIAAVVPIVGPMIGAIGAIVLWVIGLTEVHRTTTGKAIMAVLLPLALCCLCGLIAAFAMGGLGALAGMAGQAQ